MHLDRTNESADMIFHQDQQLARLELPTRSQKSESLEPAENFLIIS